MHLRMTAKHNHFSMYQAPDGVINESSCSMFMCQGAKNNTYVTEINMLSKEITINLVVRLKYGSQNLSLLRRLLLKPKTLFQGEDHSQVSRLNLLFKGCSVSSNRRDPQLQYSFLER